MDQRLRTLSAPAEDSSSAPSSHVVAHNSRLLQPWGSSIVFWLLQILHARVHAHTETHTWAQK